MFVEFLLLALPCGAEIALELGVLLELRIAVGRQHFAVGVDVDALALGLLQKQLQVVQIMAGDDDEGAFFHRAGDTVVGTGVPKVSVLAWSRSAMHRKVYLAHLQDDRQQLVHAPVLADGKERLGRRSGRFLVVRHSRAPCAWCA